MGWVGEEEEFKKRGVVVEGMPRGSVSREGGPEESVKEQWA